MSLKHSFLRRVGLFALSALPAFGIGSALATWYFDGAYEGTNKRVDADVYFDDVRQNYSIGVNNYTVYFFPNRGYADMVQSAMKSGKFVSESDLDAFDADTYFKNNVSSFSSKSYNASVSSSDAGYFGYWEENGGKSFAYKKMVIDTAITKSQFSSIGSPICDAKDKWGFPAVFAGWTTTVDLEMENGLLSQGDYGLISVFDPLRRTDSKEHGNYTGYSIDGSKLGSKTVFAYPVYTAGKDYSATMPQSVVRLHGDEVTSITESSGATGYIFTEESYLSQEGTNNGAVYSYENLMVEEDSIFYLDIAPTHYSSSGVPSSSSRSWDGTWYNYTVGEVNASSASTTKDGMKVGSGWITLPALFAGSKSAKADNAKFVGEGVYNLYVYLHFYTARYGTIGDSSARNSTFSSITKESKPLLLCQDPDQADYASNRMYINESSEDLIGVYLKIEKVGDVRLVGKNTSLSFMNGTSMFKSRDGTIAKDGKNLPYVDYQVNNVHIEGTNTARQNVFVNDEGGEYGYSSNYFSVLAEGIDLQNGGRIDGLTSSEVQTYNEAEAADYSETFVRFTSTDSIAQGEGVTQTVFEEGVSLTNFTNPDNCPFHLGQEGGGYRTNIFRITASSYGYYNIMARVYYDYGEDGNAFVSSIGLALAVVKSEQVSIWVFDGSPEKATVLEYDEHGFVDIENSPNLLCIITVSSGTPFSKDLVFTPIEAYGGIATVKELLEYDGGRKLYDHQLGYELLLGSKIRVNHVAFLKKPIA